MGLLHPVKQLGKAVAPGIYWDLQRRYHRGLLRPVEKAFAKRHGPRVVAGPFAGMKYLGEATGSRLLPKLCGSYEVELHPLLAKIFTQRYEKVIDVGCAEGYYAVGFAMKFPQTSVFAYDIDPGAQRLCRELSRMNGVADRVSVCGGCEPETLRELAHERVLLICDCEGYEYDLLDNEVVGDMAGWDLIVELHDDSSGGARAAALRARLDKSHDTVVIPPSERDPDCFPATHFLPKRWRKRALDEGRPVKQSWLWAVGRVQDVPLADSAEAREDHGRRS